MTVPCSKKEIERGAGLPLLSSSLPVKGIVRDRERDSASPNQQEGRLSPCWGELITRCASLHLVLT